MRAWLLSLILLAPALAGCASEDTGPSLAAVQTARLTGTVTTAGLEPLVGARVFVPDSPHETRTDATGAFSFILPLGDYLVVTAVDGYVNAAQRARLDGPDVELRFTLTPKPTEAPGVRIYEAHGYLSCAATVKTGDGHSGGNAQTYNCGGSDPNNRDALDFALDLDPGITGLVIEMKWDPVTDAGKSFRLHALQIVNGVEEEIGENEGIGYISIVIAPSVAQFRFAQGGTLRTVAQPAGSFLDEESPADAGLMFQQPFSIYVSVFTNAPPAPGYSVINNAQ